MTSTTFSNHIVGEISRQPRNLSRELADLHSSVYVVLIEAEVFNNNVSDIRASTERLQEFGRYR